MFGLQMINEMENLQREMARLFSGQAIASSYDKTGSAPQMRLRDAGEAFIVEAALPGIDVEKLEINVLGRNLTLSGEFAAPPTAEGLRWHRQERRSGSFRKTLHMPLAVDREKVVAEYKSGILQVRLPKAASELPKKITVKVA